jgi:hypothetical protein
MVSARHPQRYEDPFKPLHQAGARAQLTGLDASEK